MMDAANAPRETWEEFKNKEKAVRAQALLLRRGEANTRKASGKGRDRAKERAPLGSPAHGEARITCAWGGTSPPPASARTAQIDM
eukprot:SAG31_NODE_689_length_12806_cov_5.358857_11_plen_85_part_00